MFLTIKKKSIVFVILFLCAILIGTSFAIYFSCKAKTVNVSNTNWTVVIDAGHGGIDGGSVGRTTKAIESELNLKYALNLANQLKNMGISSYLTRQNAEGLYDPTASNLKRSDMKARKEIIENINPKIVISIHMNSFSSPKARGAKTFYKKGNEQGKLLANLIQGQLKNNVEYGNDSSKVGDYYILNCTDIPSVLVECGFLSNAEDEKLLISQDYQNKICYSILSGIVAFLNN